MMGVGSPAEEIVIISESEHVDLIIMGSRRLNEIFKNVALGSVASKEGSPRLPNVLSC